MELQGNKLIYTDSSNELHEAVLTETSFNLHQKEKKLHDVAIKGKPTTYFKDAFKRFLKNKSSVVATIILIALGLFAVITPLALPYDTTGGTTTGLAYLPPKLFDAGTGFWDGTKAYSDVVYDESTGAPTGDFKTNAILDGTLKTYEGTFDNNPNSQGRGGYIRIASNGGAEFITNKTSFSVDSSKTNTLSYEIYSSINNEYTPVEYYVSLAYTEDGATKTVDLVSNSLTFGTIDNIDVSSILKSKNISTLTNAYIRVGIYANSSSSKIGVFLKNISLKEDGTEIANASFSDANATLLNSLWSISASNLSGLSQASITYCSFTYDPYEAAYGNYEAVYSSDDMNNLIKKGYCEYDFNVGVSSFKVTNDLCPIVEVKSQESKTIAGITISQLSVVASKYKEKGFASMPRHLFGTDKNGIDMFKYVAEGLRNSLGIAIVISAVCLTFGLIFGSIEGYFGGYVDLIMERLVDILSNIPSIILITLCVLNLGQNFSVFMLAMCITGWIGTASITRTQFYRFKRREYVLAARSLGASDARLIYKHILPNAIGTIITSSVLIIPSVIFSEASIAYLGIGLQGQSSLGVILSDNQINISTNQYLLIFPSVILALLLICFNLFGNGLRDAFNPSTKGSE